MGMERRVNNIVRFFCIRPQNGNERPSHHRDQRCDALEISTPLMISAISLSNRTKALIVNAMPSDIEKLATAMSKKMSGLCNGMKSLQTQHLIALYMYIQLGLCNSIPLARSKDLIGNRCLVKNIVRNVRRS